MSNKSVGQMWVEGNDAINKIRRNLFNKGEPMTYKTIDDVLSDLIGGALNDKAESFVNRDGEPAGSEFIYEDDFHDVVDKAIKDIKESKYIDIRFKGEE